MAEQLSWMAKPWVPGAWDPQLFLQGKLSGRGRGRVPLGAGRRARSAPLSPEGRTGAPVGAAPSSPSPCGRSATCRSVCAPSPGPPGPLGPPAPRRAPAPSAPPPPAARGGGSASVPLPGSPGPSSRGRDDSLGSRGSHFETFMSVFPLLLPFFAKNSRPVSRSVACCRRSAFLRGPFPDARKLSSFAFWFFCCCLFVCCLFVWLVFSSPALRASFAPASLIPENFLWTLPLYLRSLLTVFGRSPAASDSP